MMRPMILQGALKNSNTGHSMDVFALHVHSMVQTHDHFASIYFRFVIIFGRACQQDLTRPVTTSGHYLASFRVSNLVWRDVGP
jgi:hypothetical protein